MKSPRANRCVTNRPASIWRVARSRSRVGVEYVSTRPVVYADVGDAPAGPRQGDGQLEGSWRPDGLDGHVGAEPAGQRADHFGRVLEGAVHGDVRAELLGRLQAGVRQVDGHDMARAEQACPGDR
jgi:hypothetical protein